MADDKKDQDTEPDRGTFAFTDRDDDGDAGFVDRDYADSFPGTPEEGNQENPDPGYSAYADADADADTGADSDDFADPLADWPSPDSVLDDLPEMREQGAVTDDSDAIAAPAAPGDHQIDLSPQSPEPDPAPPATGVAGNDDREGASDLWDAGDTPTEEPIGAPISGPLDPVADELSQGAVYVDGDHSGAGNAKVFSSAGGSVDLRDSDGTAFDLAPQDPNGDDAFAPAAEPPEAWDTDSPGDRDSGDPDAPYETPAVSGAFIDEPPEELSTDAATNRFADSAGKDSSITRALTPASDEEFVDDFLNDLDDGEDDGALEAPLGHVPEPAAEPPGAPFAADYDDEPELDSPLAEPTVGSLTEEPHDAEPTMNLNSDRSDDPEPGFFASLPLGMLVIVAIALVLLAAGGYGVIQQRSALQAEIRDLQAQLATTVSTDEAAAERERQRQVERENESLQSELEALRAENSGLADELSRLEARQEELQATREAAAAAAKAAAEREAAAKRRAEELAAQRQREAAAAQRNAPASSGPWFVNFGSYAQREVADSWAKRLQVSAGQVQVQQASAGGKTLYRVRVVGLASRDAAERVATALEREYSLPRLWVGSSG